MPASTPNDRTSLAALARDPRVAVRRPGPPDPEGTCVVYWMQRAQRATDNPALDVAVALGNLLGKPVVVFVALTSNYPGANLRHFHFFAQGLGAVARGLARRRVGLVVRVAEVDGLERLCRDVRAAFVVGDENPLRVPASWRERAATRLRVPFWTVDADVVVPSAVIGREPYAARTLRPKIRAALREFLVAADDLRARVSWAMPAGLEHLAPGEEVLDHLRLDRRVGPVAGIEGGTDAGQAALRRFVRQRLAGYDVDRNHPDRDGTSGLSPYLHFGHLGPREVALAVRTADRPAVDRDGFLEQLIVRRELAVNFVRFNPEYDQLEGCEPWALRTLDKHLKDPRPILYSERQLEHAETHDPLWNAAQMQMVHTGWMHGYLRMYWAKKILEWSESPAAALAIANRLNDTYELDGRDPNGYAGTAWSIGGKHDRAWGPERPVFGTVRYMSYASTSKKFNSRAYIDRVERTTGCAIRRT
jgi:deoxyribodipyrimidine photo-lyase